MHVELTSGEVTLLVRALRCYAQNEARIAAHPRPTDVTPRKGDAEIAAKIRREVKERRAAIEALIGKLRPTWT